MPPAPLRRSRLLTVMIYSTNSVRKIVLFCNCYIVIINRGYRLRTQEIFKIRVGKK